MKMSMDKNAMCIYVKRQLDFYLPDEREADMDILEAYVPMALERCEKCFRHILLPGYREETGEAAFSHLHMDQWGTFLYFLGNTIYKEEWEQKMLCDKLLNLNRILNGFFLSYKCPMPEVFCLAHPVGSIVGNADYSDGLVINQNVTINTRMDENGRLKLKIGRGCYLGAGAKIIGSEEIGDRVSVGADVLIYNRKIENDQVCIRGESGELIVRSRIKEKCKARLFFDLEF